VSSSDLAAKIEDARCISGFSDLIDEIKSIAKSGDIILTVGAGDIYRVGEDLVGASPLHTVSDIIQPS
jgi:UDP-N-acetylmuramate--alanine ligase